MNLEELLKDGYMVRIGAHFEARGFFANVSKNGIYVDRWKTAGHGFTVEEALNNGKLIAEGKELATKYVISDFRKTITKVTHGAWVQKFSFDGEIIEEDFEAGDIVEYFDEDGNEVGYVRTF